MRNFSNTLLDARAESARRQNDLAAKLEQISYNSEKSEIQIKQFICMTCGQLTDCCACKPSAREDHLLYGGEKREYIRDQMLHKSADKRDLPHDTDISKTAIKPVKTKPVVKSKPVSGDNFAAQESQKNAADAKKREAVETVRKELASKAALTETTADDKIARYTVKSAKVIGFETAPSAAAAGSAVREYVSGLMDDAVDDMGDLW